MAQFELDFWIHQSGTGGIDTNSPGLIMKIIPTAAQTEYALRQANNQRLLAAIDKALKKHAIKAAGDPGNWGYAGDIGAAEVRLQEVLATLLG